MPGRVWVVTGTNSGLGLAIAEYCLAQGDKVIASVRSLAKLPETLKAAGAHPLVLDLNSSDDEIQRVAKEALSVYGHVDVLVNNAAAGLNSPFEEQSMQDIRYQFQINLFGHLAFTQPFVTHFRTRAAGHIINISSIAALDAITDTLSQELTLFNVRVLSVLPGYFATKFFCGHPMWVNDENVNTEERTEKLSKIYTDPVTQGYDAVNALPRLRHSQGLVGDPEKLAARLYEVVMGTGMAQLLVPGQEGKREWTRIILGPDCGEAVLQKLETMTENVKMFEPIWRSTNMDLDK